MSNYHSPLDKLPSISVLPGNEAYSQELPCTPTNFVSMSEMPMPLYNSHQLSPPLTPAVSPPNMMEQLKRKFSVDVGPFAYSASTMIHDDDQDAVYRRSSCATTMMDVCASSTSTSTASSTSSNHQAHQLHHQQQQHAPAMSSVLYASDASLSPMQPPPLQYPAGKQQNEHTLHHGAHLDASPAMASASSSPTSVAYAPHQHQHQQSAYGDAFGMDDGSPSPSPAEFKAGKRRSAPAGSAMARPHQYQQVPMTQHKHVCKYPTCGWSFKRYEHLKRHMLVHSGERPHVCPFAGCGKSFSRSDNFHAHYRTHTKKQQQQQEAIAEQQQHGHHQQHHQQRRRASGHSKHHQQRLSHDSVMHNGDLSLDGSTDPYLSPTNSSMMASHHPFSTSQSFDFNMSPYDPTGSRSFDDGTPYFRMSMQGASGAGVSSLLNHDQQGSPSLLTMPTPTGFSSPHDNADYAAGLACHDGFGTPIPGTMTPEYAKRKRGSSDYDASEQQKSHVCPINQCQRRFKRLEHLKRHMRIHTLERPFACTFPKCNKTFSRSDNLSQHMKTHQRASHDRRRRSSTHNLASKMSMASSTSPTMADEHHQHDFNATAYLNHASFDHVNKDQHHPLSTLPSGWTVGISGC